MRDLVALISLDDTACRTMARRLRAEHIYCRILPASASADDVAALGARGILLAGGSAGVPAAVPNLMSYLQSGTPMLCMGDAALTLCETLGGSLDAPIADCGVVTIQYERSDVLFDGAEDSERYMPVCRFMQLAEGEGTPTALCAGGVLGFRAANRDVWGHAFPLERNDPNATLPILRFCREVCGCSLWWSDQAFVELTRNEILQAAGDGNAICALSGGVDSGVCALLGHMALGHRLHCIFVDTGLLRKDEARQVMEFYQINAGLNLRCIDAADRFLPALAGVSDPRQKEMIIRTLLQEILTQEAAGIPDVRMIIQGTNFADLQNREAFPLTLPTPDAIVCEPVRELFKDEIRRVGEALGMPPIMIQRQPFPGSGLASRIMTDVTEEKLTILREADAIFRDEITRSGLHKRLWQYFAALAESPVPDGGLIITLRAVQTVDGAAAMAARLPGDLMERVTGEILTRCPSVRRVMYDLTPSRSYAQVEWR